MSSTGREEIVDKLHGALAAFRRERDDLHRKKELAVERLRLVTEEREAMEKTIRSMQEKLNELNKSASDEAKLEMTKLEEEVERLNRETQFQHTELIGKKDKIARLQTQMEGEATAHQEVVRCACEAAKKRREKMTLAEERKKPLTTEQLLARMEKELQEVDNERVWQKWPRLVEQKAAAIAMEAGDLHRSSEALEKVIAGYKKHFGDVAMDDGAPLAMEQ